MKKLFYLTSFLLTFTAIAAAEVIEMTENYQNNLLKYPVITLPKKQIASAINKEISKSIKNLKNEHYSNKGAADKISMSYKVLLEDKNRLNLLLYSWTYINGTAHGTYYTKGLSYDLQSGKKANVKDYIGATTAQTLDEGVRTGRYQLLDSGKKPVQLTDFWKVETVSPECLLDKDGSLTLIYQIYDLAPYATGNTFLVIPKEEQVILTGKLPKLNTLTDTIAPQEHKQEDKQLKKLSQREAKLQEQKDKEIAKASALKAKQEKSLMQKQSQDYEKQLKAEEKSKQQQAKLEAQKAQADAKAIQLKQKEATKAKALQDKAEAKKVKADAKALQLKQKEAAKAKALQDKAEAKKTKDKEKALRNEYKIQAAQEKAEQKSKVARLKLQQKEQLQQLKLKQKQELENLKPKKSIVK